MSENKSKDASPNPCPDCGEPAATSSGSPGLDGTVFRCANGHNWMTGLPGKKARKRGSSGKEKK